ncbi:MAG: ATP synthase subunit I [Bacillota bacterium]
MAGYLEDARRGAFRVVGVQLLVSFLAGGIALLLGGKPAGSSALLGGLTGTAANFVMAWRVFGGRLERDPKNFLARMVLGEVLKFALTMTLFIVAFKVFKAAFLPLISGYVAAIAAYWVGYMAGGIGQAR